MAISDDESEDNVEPVAPPIATKAKQPTSIAPKKAAPKGKKKVEPKKTTKALVRKVKKKKTSKRYKPFAFSKDKVKKICNAKSKHIMSYVIKRKMLSWGLIDKKNHE